MSSQSWDFERRNTWRQFLSASARLVDRLDHELQRHHDLSLVDYEILEHLSEAEDARLRMSELANQVLVSRSRLTYRIDRLTEVGFVVREECEDDRRGMWAIVTDTGREAYHSARVAHRSAIDAWFFDQMSDEDGERLRAVMARISDKLSNPPPT